MKIKALLETMYYDGTLEFYGLAIDGHYRSCLGFVTDDYDVFSVWVRNDQQMMEWLGAFHYEDIDWSEMQR